MRMRPAVAIGLIVLLIAVLVGVGYWIRNQNQEEQEKQPTRPSFYKENNTAVQPRIKEQAIAFKYEPSKTVNPNPKHDAFSHIGGRLGIPPDGIELFDYSDQDGSDLDANENENLIKGATEGSWDGKIDLWSPKGLQMWKGPTKEHKDFSFENPLVHHLFNKTLESNQKLQQFVVEPPINTP